MLMSASTKDFSSMFNVHSNNVHGWFSLKPVYIVQNLNFFNGKIDITVSNLQHAVSGTSTLNSPAGFIHCPSNQWPPVFGNLENYKSSNHHKKQIFNRSYREDLEAARLCFVEENPNQLPKHIMRLHIICLVVIFFFCFVGSLDAIRLRRNKGRKGVVYLF